MGVFFEKAPITLIPDLTTGIFSSLLAFSKLSTKFSVLMPQKHAKIVYACKSAVYFLARSNIIPQ